MPEIVICSLDIILDIIHYDIQCEWHAVATSSTHMSNGNILTRKSSCVNARGILTVAYQVLLGGVPPVGVPPWPGLTRRGVPEVGYPPSGYLLSRSEKGVPKVGYPLSGYPPSRSDGQGVPKVGYPPSGYPLPIRVPPTWTWLGYPPRPGRGYPPPKVWTDRWMDRCVSKHNLPSYYVRGR